MKVPNKVIIVVVGAGNGIGREVVLELLRRGARVAAVDPTDPEQGEGSAGRVGARFRTRAQDARSSRAGAV